MSENPSYPGSVFPGEPNLSPVPAPGTLPASNSLPAVQLPGEKTLPQILNPADADPASVLPPSLPPTVTTPPPAPERAAYQSRPRRVVEKTIKPQSNTPKLRITNLRNRMLVHSVLISGFALTIVGLILLVSGIFQITHAERSQTELITNDLRSFVKVENSKSNGGLASAKDVLKRFIAAEDAPYNGSLLGFSAGQLIEQKG
ncbi:MAG: hypothetical protein E6165_06340, partial [Varibaculum cambriense]|nr:hypothetical protein [Varibaculum cambriense]